MALKPAASSAAFISGLSTSTCSWSPCSCSCNRKSYSTRAKARGSPVMSISPPGQICKNSVHHQPSYTSRAAIPAGLKENEGTWEGTLGDALGDVLKMAHTPDGRLVTCQYCDSAGSSLHTRASLSQVTGPEFPCMPSGGLVREANLEHILWQAAMTQLVGKCVSPPVGLCLQSPTSLQVQCLCLMLVPMSKALLQVDPIGGARIEQSTPRLLQPRQ